jgi:hypothetical protein
MTIYNWLDLQNKLLYWEYTGESWHPESVRNSDGFKMSMTAIIVEDVEMFESKERRRCGHCKESLSDGCFVISNQEQKVRLCRKCFNNYCSANE